MMRVRDGPRHGGTVETYGRLSTGMCMQKMGEITCKQKSTSRAIVEYERDWDYRVRLYVRGGKRV